MTEEAQRIAMVEACGWKNQGKAKGVKALEHRWFSPSGEFFNEADLPDYLNDLNVMHEADKMLDGLQAQLRAVHLYCILVGKPFEQLRAETGGGQRFSVTAWMANCLLNATAAQRAEAHLRAKGLWVE